MTAERPPRALVLALALAILVPPIASMLGAGEVGGWRMFTRIERAQLSIETVGADGARSPVALDRLLPHMGSDARRVIAPAERGTVGEIAIDSLEASTTAIGALVCAIDDVASVEVTVRRTTFAGAPISTHTEEHACAR